MRNLSILSSSRWFSDGNKLATAIAFDLDEGATYVGCEESREAAVICIQKIEPDAEPMTIGTYTSNNAVPLSYPTDAPVILSLHFMPEMRQLVFILANGDIVRYPVDDQGAPFDVIGSFECGLGAAAWSPDDTLLILATVDGKLVEMSSDFDVLHETDLRASDFGEDAHVNINWGSKSTQFHGSLGKAAAAAADQPMAPPGSSPDDDGRVRISWRGDAAFFALSTLDPYDTSSPSTPQYQRTIRVYNRDAVLQSTVEPTPGLEHALAWRPSGNFIATTQRFFGPEFGCGGGIGREGRHDFVFFERNGLRRLEVDGQWVESPKAPTRDTDGRVTWGYKVMEMSWSSDSNILAIFLRDPDGDTLQLWVTANWHWYLKLELRARSTSEKPGRYTAARWHPEDGNRLLVGTHNTIREYRLQYEPCTSLAGPPHDLGTVAVIDGCSLYLTPFRIQNIPPPMAAYTLKISYSQRPPIHVALSSSGDSLALLWSSPIPAVEVWDLKTGRVGDRGKVMAPIPVWKESFPDQSEAWQVTLSETDEGTLVIAILCTPHSATPEAYLVIATVKEGKCVDRRAISCTPNGRLVPGGEQQLGLALESSEGLLYRIGYREDAMLPISSFPVFCPVSQQVASKLGPTTIPLLFGLSSGSKLYVTTPSHAIAPLLSSAVSSFAVASSFLIYTTSVHESVYIPLSVLTELLETPDLDMREGGAEGALSRLTKSAERRRIERGSRIVTAIPSAMSLVLQMPRGNLETINPRPLVLEVVKSGIDHLEYRKAFLACRKHRIDLNFIVEHNSDLFLENVGRFVDQIPEVDHLTLFLSSIGQSKSQAPDKIALLCDSLRLELEKRGLVKYMNCILTSYVVKTPPEYEAALSLMHRLRQSDPQVIEDAVRYIMFLVDPDKLFDIALGMYDFSLVLLIAQNSQKDPREYLPFLRELWSLEESYRHYRINDYLKRYPSALKSLREGGSKYFEEATKFVEKHRLYKNALQLWNGSPQEYSTLMELYGDWLFDRREFKDAGLAFSKANKPFKAMLAHEKAHDWKSLFALAEAQNLNSDARRRLGSRIAEDLASRKRWSEAAQVYLDYTGNVTEAVTSLISGNELSEAIRIARRNNRTDLIDGSVIPGALDIRAQLGDDLEEMEEQLGKQSARLGALEEKRKTDPDMFFGKEEPALDNVDVMTDISTPMTTFTRYTTAPTATSRATTSKRTSRSKRKLDMKQAAGRKGTVDEEQYILKSLGKLAARLLALQEEAGKLLPHLAVLSDEHAAEGKQLQEDMSRFEREFKTIVEDFWKEEQPIPVGAGAGAAGRVQEAKVKPDKPIFGGDDWKVALFL